MREVPALHVGGGEVRRRLQTRNTTVIDRTVVTAHTFEHERRIPEHPRRKGIRPKVPEIIMRTTILSVAAIAAVLGLSFTASAATQAPAVEQTGRAVQAPAATDAATAPRHSHMGEKIGVRAEQAVAAGSAAATSTPAKSAATRHNHQRDFK